MNRLVNALAFAAIVMAVFVSHSNLPKKLASSQVLAQAVQSVRGGELPTLASLHTIPPAPPQLDEARLERMMEQAQRAQVVVARVETRRAMERARVQLERASGNCKVVKIDQ